MNEEQKYLDQDSALAHNVPIETEKTAEEVNQNEKNDTQPLEKTAEDERKRAIREYNTQRLREKMEASERRVKELEEALAQQRQQQDGSREEHHDHEHEEEEEISIGDEDLVSGKDIKKYVRSITSRYDQQLNLIKEQSRADAAATRLKSQYPDFDEVVSKENIKMFKTLYPEEHYLIVSNPDIYAKGKAAYNMIKNFGISSIDQERVNPDIDRRLQENKLKPRSVAASSGKTGDTPLSRVEEYDRRVLTEERKAQLRQQIAMAKKFSTR